MKYRHVAESYDKTFSEDATAHGGEPMPLVHLMERSITSGDVLDIGAGAGRNSLYLASRGFNVLATDISAVAIKNIRAKAQAESIALQTDICDIAEAELARDVDVVICANVLHHLHADDAVSVIKKVQQRTRPRGFNIITNFTRSGDDLYKPSLPQFFLDNKEHLESFYPDWIIHVSFEKNGELYQTGPGGEKLFHAFAGILAQKKLATGGDSAC